MEKTNELGLNNIRILGNDQVVVSSTWLKENKLPLYLRNVHPIIFLVNDNQYIMLQQILPKTSYNEIECAREFVLTFQTQSIIMMAVAQFNLSLVKLLLFLGHYSTLVQDRYGQTVMMIADSLHQTFSIKDDDDNDQGKLLLMQQYNMEVVNLSGNNSIFSNDEAEYLFERIPVTLFGS